MVPQNAEDDQAVMKAKHTEELSSPSRRYVEFFTDFYAVTCRSVEIDVSATALQAMQILLEDQHDGDCTTWSVIEWKRSLCMWRLVEDHECLCELQKTWRTEIDGEYHRFVFKQGFSKYEVFRNPKVSARYPSALSLITAIFREVAYDADLDFFGSLPFAFLAVQGGLIHRIVLTVISLETGFAVNYLKIQPHPCTELFDGFADGLKFIIVTLEKVFFPESVLTGRLSDEPSYFGFMVITFFLASATGES